MAEEPRREMVVLLPGIRGSVLQKDGKDMSAIRDKPPGAGLRAPAAHSKSCAY
jgi:hypothetical protein